MLEIPLVLNSKENRPSPLSTWEQPSVSPWTDRRKKLVICLSCGHSNVWHWPVDSVASVWGHTDVIPSEGRGESCCSHWLGSRCHVWPDGTGDRMRAGGGSREESSHTCASNPVRFPRVTLEFGGRSEPNVPCIDVSIDFKLCRLYCWKLFVRWLIEPLQKEPFLSLNWPLYSVSSRFWSSVLLPHLGRSMLYSVFRGGLSDAKHPACVSVFQTSQRTCAPCCWFPSLLRTESDLFMTVPRRRSEWRVCRLRRKMICLATEKASEGEL